MKSRLALATLFLLAIASRCQAKDAPAASPVAVAMTQAADAFLAALDAEDRALAVMDFDNPARLDWHNIPKPQRKGLQLRDMSPEQQELCHALLRAALSDVGYAKATRILSLENNLKEGEKNLENGQLRDPLRYFLTIFGEPAATGTWGWSFEGHHLSLNFVIRDGQVVADTPSFWGANPATVKVFVDGGPEVGVRTLVNEEQLAFDLLASLDDAQRKRAVLAAEAPADYRGPGTPQPPQDAPTGLPAADMTEAQKKTLVALLDAYAGHLETELKAARSKEIADAGIEKVHFAWQGAAEPGAPHAYRIQGPTFVLELVNYQSDPAGTPANHIHSVWRHLPTDFGVAPATGDSGP
jgi:hypothetical protein